MKTFDQSWEEIHSKEDWGKYPSEDVIRFVARNLYKLDRENTKVLDFGCGAGSNTWYLAKERFDTYGLDGSKSAVEKTKNRIREEKLKANISLADASDTGYQENHFDAIIDSAVIYANNIENIRMILKEVYRILKKDGKFFSTGLFSTETTGYNSGERIEENTYKDLTDGILTNRGTAHFFHKSEIKKLWTEAGFKNLNIDYLRRTDLGGKYTVGNYIVQAEK